MASRDARIILHNTETTWNYPETALWIKFVFQAKDAYDGSSNHKILEPSDIANAVVYATSQPEYVGVNEILIEPREAPVWKHRYFSSWKKRLLYICLLSYREEKTFFMMNVQIWNINFHCQMSILFLVYTLL